MLAVADVALVLVACLMGIDRQGWPGHATYADAALAVALVALTVAAGQGRVKLMQPARLWPALAYLGWTALSAVATGHGGIRVLGVAALIGLLVATQTVSRDGARRDRLVRAWIAGAALLGVCALIGSALAIAQVPSGLYDGRGGDLNLPLRAKGLAASFNLLASVCLVPFLLLVADGRRLVGKWRTPLLALLGVTLLLTLSRTLLAVAVGLVLLRAPRAWRVPAVGLLVLAMLLVNRCDLYRGPDGGWTVSAAPGVRWRMASAAMSQVVAHPLVGLGPGRFVAEVPWPRPGDPVRSMQAHVTALNVAGRIGVPGLVAFVLTLVLTWRRARRSVGDATGSALLAGGAAMGLDSLSMDIENFRHLWLLLGLLAGL